MSYCRFGWDDSGVYLFPTDAAGDRLVIECCDCAVHGKSVLLTTWPEVEAHLSRHRAAGDGVPDYVDEDIRRDFAAGRFSTLDCRGSVGERSQDLLFVSEQPAK